MRPLDTHKFFKTLVQTGLSEAQAEAIIDTLFEPDTHKCFKIMVQSGLSESQAEAIIDLRLKLANATSATKAEAAKTQQTTEAEIQQTPGQP